MGSDGEQVQVLVKIATEVSLLESLLNRDGNEVRRVYSSYQREKSMARNCTGSVWGTLEEQQGKQRNQPDAVRVRVMPAQECQPR